MSERYIITANNTCDLPEEFIKKNSLPIASLGYSIDGKEYTGENGDFLPVDKFYSLMREGKETKTSQVSIGAAKALFEPLLKDGYDILHLAFSSGLSGTYNSMRVAAEELSEQYPDRRIEVIDTLSASLGEGLLVYKALKMQNEGASLDEVIQWVAKNRLNLCHYFTVDDLNHLYRGGRVSMATAFVGTMLGIKPILHVNDDGKLIPIAKVRGRKQSLGRLVDYMVERSKGAENDVFFISHGDCLAEAEYLAQLIKERTKIESCVINHVGTTIGSHSGPGTVALFFFGDKR